MTSTHLSRGPVLHRGRTLALTLTAMIAAGASAACLRERPADSPARKPVAHGPSWAPGCAIPDIAPLVDALLPPDIVPVDHGVNDAMVLTLSDPPGQPHVDIVYSVCSTKSDREGEEVRYTRPVLLTRSQVIVARRKLGEKSSAPVRLAAYEDLDHRWRASGTGSSDMVRGGLVSAPSITALSFDVSLRRELLDREVPGVDAAGRAVPGRALAHQLVLDIDVPFGLGLGGRPGIEQLPAMRAAGCDPSQGAIPIFGNPSAGLRYVHTTRNDMMRFGGGLQLVAPVNAGEPGCAARGAVSALALGSAGYDLFQYAGGYLPFVAPLSFEAMGPDAYFRVEAAAQLFVPIFERARRDESARFVPQWAVEAAYRTSGDDARLFVGARLQFVASPFADLGSFASVWVGDAGASGARSQFALEPFLGLDMRDVWARVGFLTPLDHPLGFGFDHAGLYTIRLTLERRL